MKYVTIEPVERPVSFSGSHFREQEWVDANKRGPVEVTAVTAMEAIRNSRGLYRIRAEKQAVEVQIKGLKPVEDMTPEELMMEMTAHGKPPRKRIPRGKAVEFVKELRAAAVAMIFDDEPVESDEPENDDDTKE